VLGGSVTSGLSNIGTQIAGGQDVRFSSAVAAAAARALFGFASDAVQASGFGQVLVYNLGSGVASGISGGATRAMSLGF
jgi:hypothetical protein